jgi:hypothetical protein
MSTDPAALPPTVLAPPGRLSWPAALLRRIQDESATLLLLAAYFCIVLVALPEELVQDSWLTLLSGREVVEHGLPRTDTLTAWTAGREWIDQQWLAQAAAYELWRVGGLGALGLAHAALVVGAAAGGVLAARSLGATRRSATLVTGAAIFVAPWALQLRSQSLALPLFVAVLWLLAADSRAPSRRVYLVLPLLALWANLHGTVVLAALFVALRGVTVAVSGLRERAAPRSWLPRAAALGLLPAACVFASPYGLELAGYYRSLFLNPMLRSFIGEWKASTPGSGTALFYALAFASVWLLARNRRRLTGFETAALAAATVGGLLALRSIVWFGLAALVLLPLLLDGEERLRERRPLPGGRLHLTLGLTAVAAVVVAAATVAARPDSWFLRTWSEEGAREVAALAAARPEAKVFSDDRNADWLLWRHPELAGRVAQDVRFELFETEQFLELDRLRMVAGDWRRTLEGYDVLALDTSLEGDLIGAAVAEAGYRRVWTGDRLTVLVRDR